MRVSTVLVASILLAACGGSTTTPPTDAGRPTPDGGSADAGAPRDAGSPPDAGRCDVSPIPDALPSLDGSFAVITATSGPPTATGGDPVGVWVMDDVTLWVGQAAADMFDEEMSGMTGTAWVALFADGTVRMDFHFEVRLEGTLAGTIRRPSGFAARGTYTITGNHIDVTPDCVQPNGDMAMMGGMSSGLDFSVEGDRAVFTSVLTGMAGMTTTVMEGTRRTTP